MDAVKVLEGLYDFFAEACRNEPEIKKNILEKVVYFWFKERERELRREAILKAIKISIEKNISDSARIEFLCLTIILYFSVNIPYLVKRLLTADNFFVVYYVFLSFIGGEHQARVDGKKAINCLREDQKHLISKHLLEIGDDKEIFQMVETLFFYAEVLPYVSQIMLYRRWVSLFSFFGEAKDLMDYYDKFFAISPNLRLHMKKSIKELLDAIHLVSRKIVGGMEIADYSEDPSPIPSDRIKN
ncbi:hypothetical protein L6259_03955 [Candidatus Parcubacteria bacterium]|nr:hypothetical protein [Patescibacteria group bacterium]MCG2694391.1 hypothetical protein [Candidatus Parcubacteria bacterium]